MPTAQEIYESYQTPGMLMLYYDEVSKSWIPVEGLKRPSNVNYRYDKTLDTIQVNFNSTTISHKLPNNTRVRFIHEGYVPTWDSNLKPSNFDEMYIIEGSCRHYPNTDYYAHSYNCTELIQLFSDVRMETLTFTNMTSITITDAVTETTKTYVKDKYNLLSMIERIFSVTRIKTDYEDNSFINKVKIMDKDLLRASGLGADDTFNECTLFDALFKIGEYIGRVPVLYLNKKYVAIPREPYLGEDPEIYLDYLEEVKYEFLLFFERCDGVNGKVITEEQFFANNTGYVESELPDKRAGVVVSDVHNMVGNAPSYFPTENFFAHPNGEETKNIFGPNDAMVLILPYKISDVVSLTRMDDHRGTFDFEVLFEDIPCLEYKTWLIDSDRENKAYFNEGENIIHFGANIKRYTEVSFNQHYYFFNVKYYPLLDTKVKMKNKESSYSGEVTFNQNSSYLDASTYGNMLQEYINQNGSADITLSSFVYFKSSDSAYNDIYKPGTIVVFTNGDRYLITSTSFETGLEGYKVIYQANKNYIRRNYYTVASQKIREYGIPYDKVTERLTNIDDQVYISMSTSIVSVDKSPKYLVNRKFLLSGLLSNQDDFKSDFIQMAIVKFESAVKDSSNTPELIKKYIWMQLARTQCGTSVILNLKAKDNRIIGYKSYNLIYDETQSDDGSYQKPISYVDPFGMVEKVTIGFSKYKEIADYTLGVLEEPGNWDHTIRNNYFDFTKEFPDTNVTNFNSYYSESVVKIPNLIYKKDTVEQLNISYQLFYYGINNTTVSPELVKYSGLMGRMTPPTLYLIILSSGRINESDIITSSMVGQITTVANAAWNVNRVELTLSSGLTFVATRYYALCIKEGDVYKPLLISIYDNPSPILSQTTIYINV